MGFLGMDCMRHYCVQFDFEAGEVRFLEPDALKPSELGKAFPLTFTREGCPLLPKGSLLGQEVALIDTGFDGDGALRPKLFRRAIREQSAQPNGEKHQRLSKCVWEGNGYTDLSVAEAENTLGLGFLARHLVTFDFPRRIVYLKCTTSGPLYDNHTQGLLSQLKENAQLPGFSKGDHGQFQCQIRPRSLALDGRKTGDSSLYHYQFTRGSMDDSWVLHHAWRADQNGRMVEEYPTPDYYATGRLSCSV
jgi:hypothetical protein